MDIDINFESKPNRSRARSRARSRGTHNWNWRAAAERKSIRAMEVADRFFSELDLSNTTEEQDDILKYSILYGTNRACCMNTEDLSAGHHMFEFSALEDIEADEGRDEELLLEVIQNGLIGHSGFINNPARQWRGNYLYKHLENMLNEHYNSEAKLSRFESLCDGIIQAWLNNIENNDYTTYVCFNHRKITIRQLFSEIDRNEARTPEHGGEAYTFREYWDYYYRGEPNETAQEVVDRWESSYINWQASGFYFNGGRKNKKTLNKKKYNYKMNGG